jgi:hypothetical protein
MGEDLKDKIATLQASQGDMCILANPGGITEVQVHMQAMSIVCLHMR